MVVIETGISPTPVPVTSPPASYPGCLDRKKKFPSRSKTPTQAVKERLNGYEAQESKKCKNKNDDSPEKGKNIKGEVKSAGRVPPLENY